MKNLASSDSRGYDLQKEIIIKVVHKVTNQVRTYFCISRRLHYCKSALDCSLSFLWMFFSHLKAFMVLWLVSFRVRLTLVLKLQISCSNVNKYFMILDFLGIHGQRSMLLLSSFFSTYLLKHMCWDISIGKIFQIYMHNYPVSH